MKRAVFSLFLIFVISAIVHLPLAFIARFIPQSPEFTLASPNGTLWQGSFGSVQFQRQNLGALSWEVRFWRIFSGELDAEFTLAGQSDISVKGNAGISIAGVYARNIELDFNSTLIDSLLRSPFPVSSNGKINFKIDDYVYSLPWCKSMMGSGRWQNASLSLPFGQVDLGNVSANLSCQSSNLSVKSSSQSGALNSNITLTLSPPNRYKLEGSLIANENLPESIRSQLQWLGSPDKDGRYSLAFSG